MVYGKARIHGEARVYGTARVGGETDVYGEAAVCGEAEVLCASHVLVIGPVGSRNGYTTFFRDKDNEITVCCGCFLGKTDRFLGEVRKTHKENKYARVYRACVEMARMQIDLDKE